VATANRKSSAIWESRIIAFVERAAPAKEIIAQLGEPHHIYTPDEVRGYLAKTSEQDVAVREMN
jgi:hypothetical protein